MRTTKHCLGSLLLRGINSLKFGNGIDIGIDQRQLSLAGRVVEKAAFYQELLTRPSNPDFPANKMVHVELSREYFILRTTVVDLPPPPR